LKSATQKVRQITKKLDAKKIASIKAKLAKVKNPEKKAALKAQLKAA
jgi:hypothetical protein